MLHDGIAWSGLSLQTTVVTSNVAGAIKIYFDLWKLGGPNAVVKALKMAGCGKRDLFVENSESPIFH